MYWVGTSLCALCIAQDKQSTLKWIDFNTYNLPVRNNGMDTKNPPIAQILVDAAPFRYLEVLKNKK